MHDALACVAGALICRRGFHKKSPALIGAATGQGCARKREHAQQMEPMAGLEPAFSFTASGIEGPRWYMGEGLSRIPLPVPSRVEHIEFVSQGSQLFVHSPSRGPKLAADYDVAVRDSAFGGQGNQCGVLSNLPGAYPGVFEVKRAWLSFACHWTPSISTR